MNEQNKNVEPQDPKAGAKAEEEKRDTERQTKGLRWRGRRLFRRMGRRAAWSDVALKERIVTVEWR